MSRDVWRLLMIFVLLCSFIFIHELLHANNCRYFGGEAEFLFYHGSPAISCKGADIDLRHAVDGLNDVVGYMFIPMFIFFMVMRTDGDVKC